VPNTSAHALENLTNPAKDSFATVPGTAIAIVDAAAGDGEDESEDDDDVGFAAGAGVAAGQRRPVLLVKGNFHDAADAAEETLFGTEWCNIYQRGGILVRPVLSGWSGDDRETVVWRLTDRTALSDGDVRAGGVVRA
jgi:hypothetical protein